MLNQASASEIFEANNYKAFIAQALKSRGVEGHGERRRLAAAIDCQDSYVSLVLAGDRHFSIEQTEAAARYLLLNDEETEMLILMVMAERAGTVKAASYFKKKCAEKRKEHLNLRSRVKISEELSDVSKMVYYSDALYAKVHMYLTIPKARTVDHLAEHFLISPIRMSEVCRFLVAQGLIAERSGKYSGANKFLFLDRTSPFLGQHHSNFRLDAIRCIQEKVMEGVHLSMTATLSEEDMLTLRQRIAGFISELSATIKESPEEMLVVLNLDFYEG